MRQERIARSLELVAVPVGTAGKKHWERRWVRVLIPLVVRDHGTLEKCTQKHDTKYTEYLLTSRFLSRKMGRVYGDMRQRFQSNLISLTDAAQRFAVSRRTLERWIRDGRLAATPSAGDKRQRLVDPEDVAVLVQQMPKRSSKRPFSEARNDSESANEELEVGVEPTLDVDYPQMIDDVLQLLYSHHHRTISQLHPESFRELTLTDLREGPLGRDLRRLVEVARGQAHEHKTLVLAAVDTVLQALFWPAAAEDYTVPRLFWDTELGRMLALAKYRAYDPTELVSIGHAAQQLGVTRPTIYRWMDDRTLNYVRDDMTGRTFVVRRDVENLKRLAKELVEQGALLQRALAS